ncbi:carboxypeptidase-like regulatory domain-containing protein, partial [Flavobacteriaceae bacterium]|nr:carboxypeptidase-like regulatory domain-containing protein [Flavobacteriaceae bacterium]
YEAGSRNPNSISKSIENLFNPADLLNNIFGKNQIQMRKLKKMREDDEIKNLLASKFDRQVLMQLLGLKRIDINDILRNCNYSDAFIKEANDLQILEGISKCYEEFRVLQL